MKKNIIILLIAIVFMCELAATRPPRTSAYIAKRREQREKWKRRQLWHYINRQVRVYNEHNPCPMEVEIMGRSQ